MRILMLTTNSSLMDGINRHILNVAPVLNRFDGVEVCVCTVFPKGDLNAELEKNGVKNFSFNATNGHKLRILPQYINILRTFNPDIIHVHVMSLMERIVSAISFRKIKYVRTVHGIPDHVKHISLRTNFEQFLARLFQIPYAATFYISYGVMEALNASSNKLRSEVVYNPIDFRYILKQKISLHEVIGISKSLPIIGTACRIAKVKQPELFTEIMCKVLNENKDVHAVVIGDGDKELIKKCSLIVEQYQVSERFHWLGYRKDALQLIADMKCFLLTSVSEGLPTSLLECMLLKVPFAFIEGYGGLKDIMVLNNRFGPFAISAQVENIDYFTNDILTLLQSNKMQKEYVEKAYYIGKQYFDVENIAYRLVSLYKEVLSI